MYHVLYVLRHIDILLDGRESSRYFSFIRCSRKFLLRRYYTYLIFCVYFAHSNMSINFHVQRCLEPVALSSRCARNVNLSSFSRRKFKNSYPIGDTQRISKFVQFIKKITEKISRGDRLKLWTLKKMYLVLYSLIDWKWFVRRFVWLFVVFIISAVKHHGGHRVEIEDKYKIT